MIRRLAVLATLLLLSGCVTTEYVYRDRYYDGHVVDGHYVGEDRYDSGSYYAPARAAHGDYYYASDYYSSWYDYPAYASVFWPLHRSWHDPYWYPSYYYGVTFFPRNYLSFGLSYGWPHHGNWYYSPYRYSWVDNYYDWRPWYGGRNHHGRHYSPRYGSARNEAERLSRRADEGWGYGRGGARTADSRDPRMSDAVRRTPYGTYGTTRNAARDADYGGGGSSPRRDIGMRGFGVPVDGGAQTDAQREVRRQAYEDGLALPGTRQAPSMEGGGGYSRAEPSEAMRQARSRRGYDAGGQVPEQRGYARQSREYAQPEHGYEVPTRGYEAPLGDFDGGRGHDAGARAAPTYAAPPQQAYSEPAPSYREEAPRQESRGSDYSGSESRSDSGSRGEVRRVGNNREE